MNASSGELFKHGLRLRLPKQPFQILLSLLEKPGELVTREQLVAKIWGDGTFVDFEHGLNAAMNRLRQALGDSAERPRYIETVPGRGYRFIGVLERQPAATVPITVRSVIREEPRKRKLRPSLWWGTAAALVGLAFFLVWWRFHNAGTGLPSGKLIRLTNDSGLSDSPALSRDGKLVAYSSDRAKEGEMDLYVKQVAGGQPIRLTFDGAGNTTPNFSPDGSRIVFHSDRDGGGIYEIPALGGQARLLVRGGKAPVYSPDGSQVAYWLGTRSVTLWAPGAGSVWLVPAAGGSPRRVAPNLTNARSPVWSPDGKRLLVSGYSSAKHSDPSAMDWWLADANGGEAIKTGMQDALVRAGLQGQDSSGSWATTLNGFLPDPGCWPSADSIIFSADSGSDTMNLWETGISLAAGKVGGTFRRVTVGAGNDTSPSCAPGGNLVFASTQFKRDVWSLPIDLDGGKTKGPLERITEIPATRDYPSLSRDGRYLAFESTQSGPFNIWIRELETGKESPMAANATMVQRFAVFSRSGSRISFSTYEKEKRFVYVSTPGGVPEKVCEGCIRATDWSRDEKTILVFVGSPSQVNLLDVATHQQTAMLKHARFNLADARFSPDNSWVSFTARVEPNRGWIMIAPVGGPKPVPESAWIKIAEEGAEDRANWSPDGKTLYFSSARDGRHCLWGQRIDAQSHRPEGEAFAVAHLHGRASFKPGGWSAAGGRIAMVLNEGTGSIWMMSLSGER